MPIYKFYFISFRYQIGFDDAVLQLGKDPEKIKQLLAKHKEFQRTLGAKQPTYDAVMRMGKLVKDRAPKTDEPVLKQMMSDMKAKWQSVCNKSVDRQRKLEEGLLFSGQFKDAIQVRYRIMNCLELFCCNNLLIFDLQICVRRWWNGYAKLI